MSTRDMKWQHEAEQIQAWVHGLEAEFKRVDLPVPDDVLAKGACKPLFDAMAERGEFERLFDMVPTLLNVVTAQARVTPPETGEAHQ